MNLFNRLFRDDQVGITKTKLLFDKILSGQKGTLDERLEVRNLLEAIVKAYHLNSRADSNPKDLIHCFQPRCKISFRQIEIFFGEFFFDEALRANSSKDVFVGMVALLIMSSALYYYEDWLMNAYRYPLARSG